MAAWRKLPFCRQGCIVAWCHRRGAGGPEGNLWSLRDEGGLWIFRLKQKKAFLITGFVP